MSFSVALHALLLWPVLVLLLLFRFDLASLLDTNWLLDYVRKHLFLTYTCVLVYFLSSIAIAVFCGLRVTAVTHKWTPVLSRVVRRDKPNPVLIQMKNGDFYTGVLGMIPADYDVLQGPAKDFTITPPGRYKPSGKRWQKLEGGETVLLNTSNVDAIRLM